MTVQGGEGVRIDTADRDGLLVTDSEWIHLKGLAIRGAPRAGIIVNTSRQVLIEDCTLEDCGRWGIQTCLSDYVSVSTCRISGSVKEHGIYFSTTDHPVVRNCRISGNAGCGIHLNGDRSEGGDGFISGGLIDGNQIFENGRRGGAAINMDGVRDTIVRGNVIYNNYAGGITCFQGDGGGPGKGNQILNNTVYFRASEGRYALQLLGAVKDIIVRGNVLVSGKGPAFEVNEAAVGGFVAGRNLYWVLNGQPPFGVGERRMALSQWRDRSGQDARSLAADPGFVDVKQGDFTFKPDSPVHALRQ